VQNPFRYGGVVGPGAFCNRQDEQHDLRRCIENAGRLFLYAERRLGKTSLVRRVLDDVPEDEVTAVYVDLWPTDGPAAFAAAMAKAIAEASATTAGKLLERARELFGALRPSVTVDEGGAPVLTFGAGMPRGTEPEVQAVLAAPQRLAERTGRRVAVVFDEFQQVAAYEAGRVERHLRSEIQHHDRVAYLFLGSRKHLIQEMFLRAQRPLYRAAEHYPLRPIAERHWQPFVAERFDQAGKGISTEAVRAVCDLTGGHPFYVQHLCHVLWERCPRGETVGPGALDAAVEVLLGRESYAYTALWESMTKNQRRLLRGLAAEPGAAPFASGFARRHGLASPSSVQRAAEALVARDLIDREDGSYAILDRFFALWVRRLQQP
jgi:hypothetical protein